MIRENSLLVKTNTGLAKQLIDNFLLLVLSFALLIGAGNLITFYWSASALRLFVLFGVLHYVSILKLEQGIHAFFPQRVLATCHNRCSSSITLNSDRGNGQGLPDVNDASCAYRRTRSILESATISIAIISGTGKTKGLSNYGFDYQPFHGGVS